MSLKKAEVYYNNSMVGTLEKENEKYYFQYSDDYLRDDSCPAISLSFPKRKEAFVSEHLFPFFFGLLAEGDNKELQCRTLKIDENDNFTRLLKTAGKDTIGGVTVKEVL